MNILPSTVVQPSKELRCLWYSQFEEAWTNRPNKLPDDWVDGLNLKEQAWGGWKAALILAHARNASVPDDLRAEGWAVAVHNDYRLNGKPYTFWLVTKGDQAVKGEGATDAEALNAIREALKTQADVKERYCSCPADECHGKSINVCRWHIRDNMQKVTSDATG